MGSTCRTCRVKSCRVEPSGNWALPVRSHGSCQVIQTSRQTGISPLARVHWQRFVVHQFARSTLDQIVRFRRHKCSAGCHNVQPCFTHARRSVSSACSPIQPTCSGLATTPVLAFAGHRPPPGARSLSNRPHHCGQPNSVPTTRLNSTDVI